MSGLISHFYSPWTFWKKVLLFLYLLIQYSAYLGLQTIQIKGLNNGVFPLLPLLLPPYFELLCELCAASARECSISKPFITHSPPIIRCKWEMQHKLYSRRTLARRDILHLRSCRNPFYLMAPHFSSLSKICLCCSLHCLHKSNLNPDGLAASQHFVPKPSIFSTFASFKLYVNWQ